MNKKYQFTVATLMAMLVLTIAACGGGDGGNAALEDKRFTGEFEYKFDYVASDGINESHLKDILTFDGTSIAKNDRYKLTYFTGSGWNYTGSFMGDWLRRNLEIELRGNNEFRYRVYGADRDQSVWGLDSNKWSSWGSYQFNDDATQLILSGEYAQKAFGLSSLVLNKKGFSNVNSGNLSEVSNLAYSASEVLEDGKKDFLLSWTFDNMNDIGGVTFGFNGDYSSTSKISPYWTETGVTLGTGESATFNIKTIGLNGEMSRGISILIAN